MQVSSSTLSSRPLVAVVGAGSIGVGWALVFARAGLPVALHDPDGSRLATAPVELEGRFDELARFELLDETAAVRARIEPQPVLAAAVEGAGTCRSAHRRTSR
jgi:3-hydroxyacyl-CoA dehydrogenase